MSQHHFLVNFSVHLTSHSPDENTIRNQIKIIQNEILPLEIKRQQSNQVSLKHVLKHLYCIFYLYYSWNPKVGNLNSMILIDFATS